MDQSSFDYSMGELFSIVITNPKRIPIGTTLEYTGEKKWCCGAYRVKMKREDNSEEVYVFDHWIQKKH